MYAIRSYYEAAWKSGEANEGMGASGHRPSVKGGYFPVPPVDSLHDIRRITSYNVCYTKLLRAGQLVVRRNSPPAGNQRSGDC